MHIDLWEDDWKRWCPRI